MASFNTDHLLSKIVSQNQTDLNAIGYEKLTVSSTAVALTVPANAKYALVVVESSVTSGFVINYLEYGAAPTSSTGIPRSHGDGFDILGQQNLKSFKAIEITAGTHSLHVQYYA